MTDRQDDRSERAIRFEDMAEFMFECMERAWKVAPDPQQVPEPKEFLTEWRTLCRAWMMGPAGIPLLLTPRNRDLAARMLYIYGFVDDIDDTKKTEQEMKDIAKDALRAWLQLADDTRGHGGRMWEINQRLMQRFGEAMEKTTAEFAGRKP